MKQFYFLIATFFLFSNANAQIINFPDPNFKAKLLQSGCAYDLGANLVIVDANSDGEIEVSEVQSISELFISSSNISDLTGISYMTNLKALICSNNQIQTIVIDPSIKLYSLIADHNALTSIDVSFGDFDEVIVVNVSFNNLTSFTLEPLNSTLYEVNLSQNQLTNLTLGGLVRELNVSFNNLNTINGNAYLGNADFSNNQFSLLDLSNFDFDSESTIRLGNNIVDKVIFGQSPGNVYYSSENSFLDLGNFNGTINCSPMQTGNISIFDCSNLNYFTLKNGINYGYITCEEGGNIFQNSTLNLNINNCPNLSFICVDEGSEQTIVQSEINQLGLQNQVQVNSYCSFTPGGTYYSINGNSKLDLNSNGCDIADTMIPNFKFSVTNGAAISEFMSNDSGNYSIPLQSGAHTITPLLENSTYFSVSPTTLSVSFPTDTSPLNQNFCVIPNGVHNDLEIKVIPVDNARPGFDSSYKISYKNKGTQSQSGTISFVFDDAVLDFVNANPSVSSQVINALNWNFTDLQPFENREITVTLNANSPIEVPPVNGGDILDYSLSVNSLLTDETPNDNLFNLKQNVVNSFDPNDKTCLEGNTITPEMVGKEVHYLIRFENTGTANVENIVVKDMIDTTKFDINSLIPIDGSHPFVTRISNTNKVEFIFENINLPFDDANNDGYVAFKIKTKPTLVVGNSFSNTASIYFDYNFPIITNTATTNVALLVNQDFEFGDYFKIYPNPAKDGLNIETKQAIEVTSISIYNTLGQIVLVIPNTQQTKSIDVSSLKTGNYFMKINSDKGNSSLKFMKL